MILTLLAAACVGVLICLWTLAELASWPDR
jgi:hypothetical protein